MRKIHINKFHPIVNIKDMNIIMEVSGYTVIEVTADIMYFVIVGEKQEINTLVNVLNHNNKDSTINYVSSRIDVPSSNKCVQLQKKFKKKIIIDSGVESAQCFTYAEGFSKKTYMIMMLEEESNTFSLSYPKMKLDDDTDPEETVLNWIKKRAGKIPHGIKKSIRPLTVVGIDDNILVYVAKIKNTEKVV